MSKVTDYNVKIGHLAGEDESKIATLPVANGQVVYSEKSGLQFIDYADSRHTLGPVLTGIYNGTTFVDFSTMTPDVVLTTLQGIGIQIADGQVLKINGNIYRYRFIGGVHFIAKTEKSEIAGNNTSNGFVIFAPGSADITMDMLVNQISSTGNNLLLMKVKNGSVDSVNKFSTADTDVATSISITHVGGGLYIVRDSSASAFDVLSYSTIPSVYTESFCAVCSSNAIA